MKKKLLYLLILVIVVPNLSFTHRPLTWVAIGDSITYLNDHAQHEHLKVVDLYHDRRLSVSHTVRYKRLRDPQTGEYRNYAYPEYTGIPFNPGVDEYPYPPDAMGMTYDGLHPSDKGNAYIAKRLVKVLRKL